LIKSSHCGKEEGEDGLFNNLLQSTAQFREQSLVRVFQNISEDMGLIKNENDKRMPWPFTHIQFKQQIYEFAKFFTSLLNPPIACKAVLGRANCSRLGCFDRFYIAFHHLERSVTMREMDERHRNLPH